MLAGFAQGSMTAGGRAGMAGSLGPGRAVSLVRQHVSRFPERHLSSG
ncbi:hypothetical protein [Streptomyces kanasensis]|nr:hypothetical protein [Streptomyces kanasensis]